jgi:hypothetical protein
MRISDFRYGGQASCENRRWEVGRQKSYKGKAESGKEKEVGGLRSGVGVWDAGR